MPEETLFKSERLRNRSDVAAVLRDVADSLDSGGGELTISADGNSLELDVPAEVTFEVKAERETNGGPDELSIEFELEWDESDQTADGALSIE